MKKINQDIEKRKRVSSVSLLKQAAFGMIFPALLCSTYTVFANHPDSMSRTADSENSDQTPGTVKNNSLNFQVTGPIASIVDETRNENKIKIYPNPSTGVFQITSSSDQQYLEVFNASGSSVYKNNCDTHTQIVNLTDCPNGIYYIRIVDKNNNFSTLTISKEL